MRVTKKSVNFFILYSIFAIILFLSFQSKSYASSNWNPSTSLLNTRASHSTFLLGNKIFIISGANAVIIPNIISNNINANGSLDAWSVNNSSPAVFWHSSTHFNNYVYMLGGATNPPTLSTNKVYIGQIVNNNIPTWTEANPLPKPLSVGSSFVFNNKIYFAGGFTELGGNIYSQKIYAADINSIDGSLGGWIDVGNLPVPLSGFGLFIQDDHIIIAGGENSNGKSNKTYTTTFQTDGTINIWTETSNLPVELTRAQFTKYNSTIFTIGGIKSDGTSSDQVYFTQIKSDGTLEP